MGRKLKVGGHCPSIYFQMFDEDKWAMVDRLMTLPKYAKSRTSLINNALSYGLPILIEKEFGEIKLEDKNPTETVTMPYRKKQASEMEKEMIRLLKEINMSVVISSSILSSLFNIKAEELEDGNSYLAKKFKKGLLKGTPEYLERYEIETLKELSEV